MARALKYNTEHYVAGYDIRRDAVRKALLVGAIDEMSKIPTILTGTM